MIRLVLTILASTVVIIGLLFVFVGARMSLRLRTGTDQTHIRLARVVRSRRLFLTGWALLAVAGAGIAWRIGTAYISYYSAPGESSILRWTLQQVVLVAWIGILAGLSPVSVVVSSLVIWGLCFAFAYGPTRQHARFVLKAALVGAVFSWAAHSAAIGLIVSCGYSDRFNMGRLLDAVLMRGWAVGFAGGALSGAVLAGSDRPRRPTHHTSGKDALARAACVISIPGMLAGVGAAVDWVVGPGIVGTPHPLESVRDIGIVGMRLAAIFAPSLQLCAFALAAMASFSPRASTTRLMRAWVDVSLGTLGTVIATTDLLARMRTDLAP